MLAIVALAGCSRGDAAPRGQIVNVRQHDFKLAASVDKVHAGLVTFRVHNLGPSTHEFVVVRTDISADGLPLRADRLSVNEAAKALHRVGSLSQIRLGATRDLTLRLKPGTYVLFCNLLGHYRGGMYAALQVTD